MTTLVKDTPRDKELGDMNDFPVIASDIIFEGSAVGLVDATGYARPLESTDKFVGFCACQVDNTNGSAGAVNVRVNKKGTAKLSVTGAAITDVGQPVYASDDDTFTFLPTGAVFIGFVRRFVSSGIVIVEYDAENYKDPYGGGIYETISVNKSLDSEDSGKTFFVDTDAVVITLPAVATPALCKIVNIGAYGSVAVTISPAAADSVEGPDITAADDKDIINTKATARRGDYAVLGFVDADGYAATDLVGTWARQA